MNLQRERSKEPPGFYPQVKEICGDVMDDREVRLLCEVMYEQRKAGARIALSLCSRRARHLSYSAMELIKELNREGDIEVPA